MYNTYLEENTTYNITFMRLFRRSLDLDRALVRPATAADLGRVSRLLRDGARRFYGILGSDLPALIDAGHATLIEQGHELWAVALVGWRAEQTIWLRAVALVDGLEPSLALGALLPSLHHTLYGRGLRAVFYAGDEGADAWLAPALQTYDYHADTEVVVYEKRDLTTPDLGNPDVIIRPALSLDIDAVVAVDRACFEPQWTKDDTILGPAISQGALFIVAEMGGDIAGYAYATRHFGGKLVHLVRIAVAPRWQGQAIGVRLLAEVIAFARYYNATAITLNTQAYNTQAQRLYQWFGFVTTGERQTVMRHDLTAANSLPATHD